ncbi:MAG: hypothetical protein QF805_03515 [Pirellulaceae bacterium]|jgi:hypothetical protein|nr:hypothetical protein [Pirellulaceae bacterium]
MGRRREAPTHAIGQVNPLALGVDAESAPFVVAGWAARSSPAIRAQIDDLSVVAGLM